MAVAHIVARRSLCDRDQVGAVVVSASNRIVDTGYNGPPRGMPQGGRTCSSWCPRARRRSHKPDCGLITTHHLTCTCGAYDHALNPDYDDCHSLHAEANALMFGDRTQREGGTIYISSGVCGGCAKLVANSGLLRVVCDTSTAAPHRNSGGWFAWLELCGVKCESVGS